MELEKVLEEFFTKHTKKYTATELARKFELTENELNLFYNALYNLEKQGKIYLDDYGYYMHVPEQFYLKHGLLHISNKGSYYCDLESGQRIHIRPQNLRGAKAGDTIFVEPIKVKRKTKHKSYQEGVVARIIDPYNPLMVENTYFCQGKVYKKNESGEFYLQLENQTIPIGHGNLNTAYVGDTVNAQVSQTKTGKLAKVISIIHRKTTRHVFEYKAINNQLTWLPINTEAYPIVFQNDDDIHYQEGDRILAEIIDKASYVIVNPIKKLTTGTILKDKISCWAHEYGFDTEFSEAAIKESNLLESDIETELQKRVDLRNLPTFTIDPETAKDLDDAFSIEVKEDRFLLYVHIADVSHYVKPGTNLLKEAIKRGTSVYPANLVIPMLMSKISNELCSLNPDDDKLAFTCKTEWNKEGKLLDFSLFKSIIHSNYQMNYKTVNDILLENKIPKDYVPFVSILKQANELATLLEQKKIERGSICFNAKEFQFDIIDGKPQSLTERTMGPAQKMIENFMLSTNWTLANYAYWLGIPYVYRNHDQPSLVNIKNLEFDLKKYMPNVPKLRGITDSKVLQKILLSLYQNKTLDEKKCISELFLSAMTRAYYSSENNGHFGLALEEYATFTSPIRKATDLLNHTILNEVIEKGTETELLEQIKKDLPEVCIQLSERQYNADCFERDIDQLLLQEYAMDYINQELPAKILMITEDSVYIQTTNENIPGIIHLTKDFVYEPSLETGALYHKTTKEQYHVGDEITVILEKDTYKRRFMKCHFYNQHQKDTTERIEKGMQKKKGMKR